MFDFCVALAALVILSPVFVFLAMLVRWRLGSPVFFRQQRPGFNGKPFELLKFRTMRDEYGPDGKPIPDAERLGEFGQKLRSTSLDELPELWNVVCGDMSLVGPRPLLMEYLPLYTARQARRHAVRPGITGWAQVNGRNAINWKRKFELDVWYVEHRSFALDIRILVMTMVNVFRRAGISQEGHVTAEKFTGEKP